MSTNGNGTTVRMGPEALGRPLPKRFYREVTWVETPGGYRILLDGRPVRTPGKREVLVPTARLATALATEWSAQKTVIDPADMALTRLVNTAIDGVRGREGDVIADIAKYGCTDLLCYRAEHPAGLVKRQSELWDPALAWASDYIGVKFEIAQGIMHVRQPSGTSEAIAARLKELHTFELTSVHVMTALMGSALLALAVLERRLTAEAAWAAAHVDEDWQIAEWGHDAEAAARRERRWKDKRAAADLISLMQG